MGDIIPSVVDGLKESERILLFCAFKKYGLKEVEVEQLARDSYMFRPRAKYLLPKRMAATVRMAQDVAGANNINLLLPISDFGSRYAPNLSSGSDLMIKLNPISRILFQEDDDLVAMKIFKGCEGCGRLPTFLLPIIPLVLVNGTDSLVSGYRSYVPKYRPYDIIANLRRLLKKEDMDPMVPWFEGFKGSIEACQDDNTKFIVSGVINVIDYDSKTVEVTELPIGILAKDYIKLLEDGSIPHQSFVDFSDYNNQSLCLRVSLLDEDCKMDAKHLLEKLKLTTVIDLNDMYLIDVSGTIQKYDSPLEVIRQFYDFRIQFFQDRRELLMDDISRQLKELDKEIDESCLTAKQCLNVIKSMKGRLPLDLNALFDVFIDQDIGKIKEATISVEYIDEAEGILATLLNQIVPVKALLLGNDEAEQPIIKVYAQPKARDPFFWLETAENQIERLLIVLQALKKVRVNRSAFLQKFNDLKQANASSLWLDDLQQLEEYLTEQDHLSLASDRRTQAASHLTGEGKKRKRPLLECDLSRGRYETRVSHFCPDAHKGNSV